jgi:hypothetical protein
MIKDYGKTPEEVAKVDTEKWTTEEVRKLFNVEAFAAPFVIVTRISDGKKGTLEFGHSPRVYFNWKEE